MTLICVSTGTTKLLTINNEYEVINETENRYIILNNKGVQQRYDKRLFTIKPEEVEDLPQAPPPVEIIDEIEVVTGINYTEADEDSDELGYLSPTIVIKIKPHYDYVFNFVTTFTISPSTISCGIREIQGINTFMHQFNKFKTGFIDHLNANSDIFILSDNINVEELFVNIQETLFQDLIQEFDFVDENINPTFKAGTLFFSTNITNNNNLDITTIACLDNISEVEYTFRNPNSDNTCKFWAIELDN